CNLIPGTRPIRRTTMRRRLLPVRTLTALLIVMFSRLTLFTSVILSPTHSPACSTRDTRRWGPPGHGAGQRAGTSHAPSMGALMRMTRPMGEAVRLLRVVPLSRRLCLLRR
uniref:Uncharacterized protein n=1 Tax=Corvus moneduloides TaxID=1196302 RepID=A0A8C3DL47_CORMO